MRTGRVLPIFTVAFALGYGIAMPLDLVPFIYYPASGEFALTAKAAAEAGPPILWYGWIASGFIGGALAALLGLAMPRRWDRTLWPALSWLVPVLTALLLTWQARLWFL